MPVPRDGWTPWVGLPGFAACAVPSAAAGCPAKAEWAACAVPPRAAGALSAAAGCPAGAVWAGIGRLVCQAPVPELPSAAAVAGAGWAARFQQPERCQGVPYQCCKIVGLLGLGCQVPPPVQCPPPPLVAQLGRGGPPGFSILGGAPCQTAVFPAAAGSPAGAVRNKLGAWAARLCNGDPSPLDVRLGRSGSPGFAAQAMPGRAAPGHDFAKRRGLGC